MGVAQIVRALETILRSIVFARLLGVESYAFFALTCARASLFQELFNCNFGVAAIKYGVQFREEGNVVLEAAIIKASYVFTIASAILAFLVLIAVPIDSAQCSFGVYAVFAAATAFSILNLNNKSILRLYDRFRESAIQDVVVSTINLLLIGFLFTCDVGLETILLTLAFCLALQVVASSLLSIYALTKENVSWLAASLKTLIPFARTLVNFVFSTSISATLGRVINRGDILLLGHFSGASEVSSYDLAKKLANFVLMLREPLALAAFPQVGMLINRGRFQELRAMIRSIVLVSAIPFALTCASLAVFGGPIVSWIYGSNFSGSSALVAILTASMLLRLIFFWGNSLLLNSGKHQTLLLSHVVALVIGAGVAGVLAPSMGATGTAVGYLLSWAVIGLAFSVVATKLGASSTSPNQ